MSRLRQMPLFPSQPATPEDINRHTPLGATISLFQAHLKKEGKSEHTIKAFASDLLLVGEYLGGDTPVGDFTTTSLQQFMNWLEHGRGVPCSRKSYARRVTTLKVYFKWLHALGAIIRDPAAAVLQRSGQAPLSEVLSEQEIEDAIDHAQNMKRGEEYDYRPELVLRLLLDTGIKKGEAMALLPSHIDRSNPDRPTLTIRHKVRNVFKERRVELSPEWLDVYDRYMQQYSPKETIFNCTSRNLEYILTDIGEGAGIPAKLSFEMLRWTCAVRDFRNGIDEDIIREKLGLSKISWYETGQKIKRLAAGLEEEEGKTSPQ